MKLRKAESDDIESVISLYDEARGRELCVWNEFYPTCEDAKNDFEHASLYVLDDNGNITGAVSVVFEKEMDEFDEWTLKGDSACEIARVVIGENSLHHGYGGYMVSELEELLRREGYKSVHLSVAVQNIPAEKTYLKLGYVCVGYRDMYEGSYILMEKLL